MAAIVTFDPTELIIEEISVGGDNAIQAIEIYSEWKDWVLGDFQRQGFPPAFEVVGGNPLPSGSIPGYFFLTNGWKFRPAELNHRVRIIGNLYSLDGTPINVPTIGAFNVQVETEVSPQALQVGSDFTAQEQAQLLEIWKRLALDATDPFTHTPSELRTQSGDIVIAVTGDGETTSTGTRQ